MLFFSRYGVQACKKCCTYLKLLSVKEAYAYGQPGHGPGVLFRTRQTDTHTHTHTHTHTQGGLSRTTHAHTRTHTHTNESALIHH